MFLRWADFWAGGVVALVFRKINLISKFYVYKEAELEQKRSERHGTLKTCKVYVVLTNNKIMTYDDRLYLCATKVEMLLH